ncbi:TIGR03086 family metal-binding protein [Actinomadura sp. HBU206391]|uniref:TIGR03086 family metal-binding protein n=1 Tax=Actinomadura sp. HBU206391 TaxID=2731692 RepID=UPI00164F8224|nr:TIGR03086 family metal-binding protein [Actinomadura sp. HBU206391]MBC6461288.1 TIGR03086 family protein [Actinomadura sp. HBU206391]
MDIRELDHRAADTLGTVNAQVDGDRLHLPTPCADWTLYGLIRHQVSDNLGFAAAASGASGDLGSWNRGELGDDPYAAYVDSVGRFAKAFADDAVLDRELEIREFGRFSGKVALGMHMLDCVVHGWDVAQSIGVSYRPDADLVEHALAVAAFIPDGLDSDRPRPAFAPAIGVPEGAPPLDRLLALVGRRASIVR